MGCSTWRTGLRFDACTSSKGLGIKAIAARLGIARNTVRSAVRWSAPPGYERAPVGSRVDAYEPGIRAQLQKDARMPATVIAERIDWPGGMSVLRERVRELRPLFFPADASQRTTYRPGDWRSGICGSPRSTCRWATTRPAGCPSSSG